MALQGDEARLLCRHHNINALSNRRREEQRLAKGDVEEKWRQKDRR